MQNEIIIDGCNVAGCSLYNNGKCLNLWNSETKEYDKCNSYCDYGAYARQEQLQRAKAENEKLKQALEEMKEIANHLKEDTGKYDIYDISDKIDEVLK